MAPRTATCSTSGVSDRTASSMMRDPLVAECFPLRLPPPRRSVEGRQLALDAPPLSAIVRPALGVPSRSGVRAMSDLVSPAVQDAVKLLFSAVSLLITLYFWYVRINRERVALRVYPVGGFEGALQNNGDGIWTGRIFIANRSI